ncbi:TonB-dependent siderophore receptor [Aliarcobacter vitoriensis]|uniref:TonB-dependent siderophore receptor n=1 Tax=Aliarcobacter vitoriensis TaxID=2011099 RepID=UPI001C9C3E3A|nr:TonB-dependent siderophore receptor [Aliarcobacter vitoriensis]
MRTATKLDLSIRETPQSVSVITQQMIEDKKIDDFKTLMKNVTGVSSNDDADFRESYSSRGFRTNFYLVDGIPTFINAYSNDEYNMDMFDRVEIVKGANGLTSGTGNPAVSINMVRKHANSKVFTGDIDISAGTWDMYKLKTDIQTPLNQDGSVRARLVASYKEKDSFVDRVNQENSLVYAVIDADITDNTTISAGASYELDARDGVLTNLPPFYADGTKTNFDRSKNTTPDWASWDTQRKSYFISAKHYFDNDISINAIYTHNDMKTKDRLNSFLYTNPLNKDGTGLEMGWFYMPQNIKQDSLDIYSSIPFKLGNKEHEIIAGFQYYKNKANNTYKSGNAFTIDNYYISNGSEFSKPDTSGGVPYEEGEEKQTAFYLNGKFEILDDLKLILGGRLSNYDYESMMMSEPDQKFDAKNEFTPFVGLVYDIDENHSVYASYTDVFQPNSVKDANNKLLEPILGKNYEVGLKGQYFDKRLNTSLTLFRIEQDNVAVFNSYDPVLDRLIYDSKDGVTSKGVEFEIAGKITDNWDLSLGFANFEAKDADKNKVNTTTPRNNINLFTKYSMDAFSLGVGVNWKSKGYDKFEGRGEIKQDAYATVDLMASYEFTKNLSGQININNLFDKKYYAGYNVFNGYSYGEPVNGMLSIKYKF